MVDGGELLCLLGLSSWFGVSSQASPLTRREGGVFVVGGWRQEEETGGVLWEQVWAGLALERGCRLSETSAMLGRPLGSRPSSEKDRSGGVRGMSRIRDDLLAHFFVLHIYLPCWLAAVAVHMRLEKIWKILF